MTIRRPRPAFTLIELLVVMGIMVVIATLGFLFLPNLNRNKGVPNATTQLEGWIRLSRSQALRNGAPRGIRLIDDGGGHVTSLQYIEQPEPVAPRGPTVALIVSTSPPAGYVGTWPTYPYPPGSSTTALLSKNWNDDPLNPQVSAGDFLELTGSPNVVAMITGVSGGTLTLDRVIDGTDAAPLTLTDGFRVVRSPRPLQGEPLLQMHKDAYIDLTYGSPCPTNLAPAAETNGFANVADWSPTKNLDILFTSSGQVANAPTGQIMLCVRHVDRDTGGSGSDRLLVIIYTRTGKITAVDWNDVPGTDPFVLGRDGKSSGL